MKQNEPVRPAGIGRGQVAFNTSRRLSPLDVKNPNEISIVEQHGIEGKVSAVSFARAISTATATSLKQDIQNNCFEMVGMQSSFMSTGGIVNHVLQSGVNGIDINWNMHRIIVNSPFYFYNPVDRFVYIRKPGWYLVRVFMFAPAVNAAHEWGVRLISNITLSGVHYEDYNTWIDYNHQPKHPYINGTTMLNIPATVETTNNGLPGFKLRLQSSADNVYLGIDTTIASLQVIRLSDIEYSTRRILTQV